MATPNRLAHDAKRLKYVRALERFKRSVAGYLIKDEGRGFEGLKARIAKQKGFLDQVEAADLYKEEFTRLEAFVKMLLRLLDQEQEDYDSLKAELLHHLNQLHKDKNRKKYRKEKHAKAKFSEWE